MIWRLLLYVLGAMPLTFLGCAFFEWQLHPGFWAPEMRLLMVTGTLILGGVFFETGRLPPRA